MSDPAKRSTNSTNYPLQGVVDNTLGVKIDAVEKTLLASLAGLKELVVEKEKALLHRIEAVEKGESDRKDRLFKWKTVAVSGFLGFLLGIMSSAVTKYFN